MCFFKSLRGLIFLICLITGVWNPCFADGGLFPMHSEQIGNSALSPNQRAVVIYDDPHETLIVQVKYSGNVRDFAWVVPLPSLPDENSIQTENDSIFTLLHDRSQPRIYWTDTSRRGMGGGGVIDGNGADVLEEENAQAQVWKSLVVGPYDVQIISGTTAQVVRDWLSSNGYDYAPSSDEVLDFYVQKGWYFMATKVNVEEDDNSSSYQAGLPALKLNFPVEKPVFPLRISEISSSPENEIELYVIGDHRMISDSYPTYAMDQEEVSEQIKAQIADQSANGGSGLACACRRVTDPAGENGVTYDYESIFQNKLSSLAQGTWIIESVSTGWTSHHGEEYSWEGTFGGYFDPYFPENSDFFITRLRTILSPSEMVDDVTFIPDPAGDETLYLNTYINRYNPWQTAAMGLPLLILFPVILSRKLRKQHGRHILLLLFALYLILF